MSSGVVTGTDVGGDVDAMQIKLCRVGIKALLVVLQICMERTVQ